MIWIQAGKKEKSPQGSSECKGVGGLELRYNLECELKGCEMVMKK